MITTARWSMSALVAMAVTACLGAAAPTPASKLHGRRNLSGAEIRRRVPAGDGVKEYGLGGGGSDSNLPEDNKYLENFL